MKLNGLSIKDKKLFDGFLGLTGHVLSAYTFENIYIWKELFNICWAVIDGSLCVFFKDKTSCFMYLPPLAEKVKAEAVQKSFVIMNDLNKNKAISRIENTEEGSLPFYQSLGYECRENSGEYLCRRTDMAELRGDTFRSKRSAVNYFIKHYRSEYMPFSPEDGKECLALYGEWAKNRRVKNTDRIYCGMLDDNYSCLKTLLYDYDGLNFEGRIVRMKGRMKGFTFGFRLSKDIFCVLYEITDLNIKGISQFIFQKFCKDMAGYKYINIMDDSKLENLRKVKLSYHPAKLIPAYTVKVAYLAKPSSMGYT